MSKSVVFRCDGSPELGMGHVMRCRAFADRLKEHGASSIFVMRGSSPDAAGMVSAGGHGREEIPFGCTLEEDLRETMRIADERGAAMVVTDICHTQALKDLDGFLEYHGGLAGGSFTMCIAGSTVSDVPCHLVVSPYFRESYPRRGEEGFPVRLIGPKYFIFRREFVETAKMERPIRVMGSRLLVTVGGSDELGITKKIVEAVVLVERRDLELRIIIGPAFPGTMAGELEEMLSPSGMTYAFLDNSANMAEEMFRADVAVTGDGLTKYETAVTGTPSIMLSRFDSEHELDRQFSSSGANHYAGDFSELSTKALGDLIDGLLNDRDARERMSRSGKRMVDGKGLDRIIEKIPREIIQ